MGKEMNIKYNKESQYTNPYYKGVKVYLELNECVLQMDEAFRLYFKYT